MAGMERFTQRARRVLSLAHQEAERSHHSSIGTEQLLIGLLEEGGGVAGRVLRELGTTSDRVREVAARVSPVSPHFDPAQVELGTQVQQSLELAVEEARRLGHHYIGTEHILLGLVRFDNTGMEILRRLGLNAEQIRRQTRRVLDETPSSHTASFDEPSRKLNQVFILHGQEERKKTVAALIQALGLVPVLLDKKNEGKTRIEYLDQYSNDVVIAVVILTDNDPEILQSDPAQAGLRIDRKVVFELGYFRGKLGHNRLCVLYLNEFQEEVGLLSNLVGGIFIPLDKDSSWMVQLARAIQDAELK